MKIDKKNRSLIFFNILVTCIATSMLATSLTTALPPILSDFKISATMGQWLTSGYSLAMGIMMPATAFLIRRFKTKRLYLSAIACFMFGLVIDIFAPNFTILMVGRIFQAAGNGILTSMAQVVLFSIYPKEEIGSIMGLYGLSIGAAPVIAPTIAGIIVDHMRWQMIFVIALIIIAISFILAVRVFEDVLDNVKQKFDIFSFILSAFAYSGVILGIGNIGNYKFLSVNIILPLIIGILSMSIFVYRQLHMKMPFLELRILKNRDYMLSVIGSMMLYLVMMGSSIIMPLYVQSIKGMSATISGLVTLPGSLLMAIVSPFAGRIYDRIGMKKLFVAGALFMFISNLGMVFIRQDTSVIVASILNSVRCVSIGCLMMTLVTWGISGIEAENTAHGTALLTSLRTIAGSIGSAVFVAIMTVVSENSLGSYGKNAYIHGLNTTFAAMSCVTIILLCIAAFYVKEKKNIDSKGYIIENNTEADAVL